MDANAFTYLLATCTEHTPPLHSTSADSMPPELKLVILIFRRAIVDVSTAWNGT